MSRAVRKFADFHARDPRKVTETGAAFKIPSTAILVGHAVNVMYRSDKLNPTTHEDEGWIDYIHDHEKGVNVYRTDRAANGPERAVPAWIRDCTELTWLGDCLGFTYKGDEHEEEAKGTKPLPGLYSTPNGKALLVIQGKAKVLAIIWGGRLGVEARGIVH